MDTSETYIKMCEKAEEIQRERSKEFIAGSSPSFIYNGDDVYIQLKGLVVIWLPRQDQLQEMIADNHFKQHQFLSGYFRSMVEWSEFLGKYRDEEYWESFTSWEQLWLAFVMREKYKKVWNGEDWIKKEAK